MSEQKKMDDRAAFEAYMLGREHPTFGWISSKWFGLGDHPSIYENDYVQGCWVMWQDRSLPVGVPDGYVLVPVEPTSAMLLAAGGHITVDRYQAMLAAAPTVKAEQPDMADAYVGAREDLAIWKRRALEAEQKVRHQEQIIDHLTLEAQGETRLGEPSMPSAEPVAVIEYAGYDPANSIKWLNKGLQYMEPGTLLYAQAPSLPAAGSAGEEVEVVAWVYTDTTPEDYLRTKPFVVFALPDGSAPGPVTHENEQRNPLMTVAQHERIVAAFSAQQSAPERVSVPVELLRQGADLLEAHSSGPSIEQNIADDFRTILASHAEGGKV